MSNLLERVEKGEARALARAMTLAETGDQTLLEALDARHDRLPRPRRIGLTGPPGAGKSTLTSLLVSAFRTREDARVGVVAVDPTSPFSGGALLGDRHRMVKHALDDRVFVRSMATRGRFGGLASGCEDACDLLALAGFDPVLVETVGVGQSEVDIAGLADTTLVVLTPGAGDSVQALKAGIMEVADVVVINKADIDGAERLEQDIRDGLELRAHEEDAWMPPILRTIASRGDGIDELVNALDRHRQWLAADARLAELHRKRLSARFQDLVVQSVTQALRNDTRAGKARQALWERVAAGEIPPRRAAAQLLSDLGLT